MNYYSIERSTDHLAHYGVKGMKWGVRRALAQGNEKALDRHFKKASKKLAKLQDIGLNSKKYAAKSAAYGAAAAGFGTTAVAGTSKTNKGLHAVGEAIHTGASKIGIGKIGGHVHRAFNAAGNAIEKFGAKNITNNPVLIPKRLTISNGKLAVVNGYRNITGNDIYRLGTGALAAGLAAKSAQNAYRASHGAKYRQKALDFKNQMDESFRGTKYEGQYIVPPKKKKKRR